MKHIYLFLLTIILCSCKEELPVKIEVPQHLEQALEAAENFGFRNYDALDSILTYTQEEIKQVDDNELWAKYYLLKAQKVLIEAKHDQAALLIDSATFYSSTFTYNHQDKINLLYGLIYEGTLLYKEALEYLQPICEKQCNFSDNDKLVTILANARILFFLKKDYKSFIKRADSLVSTGADIDLGLYYSHKRMQSSESNKNQN